MSRNLVLDTQENFMLVLLRFNKVGIFAINFLKD